MSNVQPMAVVCSYSDIRKAQEQRAARMKADELRRRFAGYVADADGDGVVRMKPAVYCPRSLPPSAA